MSVHSSLTVDNILSDLRILSASSSGVEGAYSHALLRLGHDLLPNDVRSEPRVASSSNSSSNYQQQHGDEAHGATPAQQLAEVQRLLQQQQQNVSTNGNDADAQQRQTAAFRLSQTYVALARRMVALNGASTDAEPQHQQQVLLGSNAQPPPVAFEQLHRRVARLQTDNDAELRRLEELRALVVAPDSGNDTTAHTTLST